MQNTYFLRIQGFPDNYTCDSVSNKIRDRVEKVLDVSIGFDKNFLVAVIFLGTPEKCIEELGQLHFNKKKLTIHLIEPFPIFKNCEPAPMLYEDESNPFPYFPDQRSKKDTNSKTNNNNEKYYRYNEFNSPTKNSPTKNSPTLNSNYRLPPPNDPSASPWSAKGQS